MQALLPRLRAGARRDHQGGDDVAGARFAAACASVNIEAAARDARAGQVRCCSWPLTSATGSGCCSALSLAARLSRRCGLQAAGESLGGARDVRDPHALRQPADPAPRAAAGHHQASQGRARAIAMVADQEPTTSEHKHWMRFLNRDTAFYMGAEEIARVTKYPVFFVGMRRTARGFYEIDASSRSRRRGEKLHDRRADRAIRARCAKSRSARRRRTGRGRTSGGG